MKNLTWQNPEQLFVAQVLINKVKSKCCGIKVELTCFQDKSYEVAKSIIKNNNTRKPTYSEVEKAINNTSLKKDFDNILKQYDLKTSKIICGDSPIIIFRRTDLTDLGKRNYDRELGLSVLVRIRLDKLSLP